MQVPPESVQSTSSPDSTVAGTAPTPDASSGYKAFYSVQPFEVVPWQFLDQLIAFYCELTEPRILDATVNEGRIWGRGKSRYKYTGMDIDPSVHPDVVADNTAMPFANRSWDVIVYDPPHTGDQGKSQFAAVYGTGVATASNGGLAHTYPTFLNEARRVLRPEGLLLAKLADCTHRNKFHFATAEFYSAAREYGFDLQGYHILPRRNVIIDPKWRKASHSVPISDMVVAIVMSSERTYNRPAQTANRRVVLFHFDMALPRVSFSSRL